MPNICRALGMFFFLSLSLCRTGSVAKETFFFGFLG